MEMDFIESVEWSTTELNLFDQSLKRVVSQLLKWLVPMLDEMSNLKEMKKKCDFQVKIKLFRQTRIIKKTP